jgi:glucose-6-phosphate-specific signal transduction histidine kinase
VSVNVEIDDRLPRPIELPAYSSPRRRSPNVGKYAEASSASVRVWRTDSGMAIEISDDGSGGASAAGGSGLRGLTDRVEAVGGSLRVSSPVGAGTVLVAELPCEVAATHEIKHT